MEGTQMEYKKTLMSFSLREILVLLIPVVILLLFLAPRYLESINTSKENLLRHELIVMRSAIDQYLGVADYLYRYCAIINQCRTGEPA